MGCSCGSILAILLLYFGLFGMGSQAGRSRQWFCMWLGFVSMVLLQAGYAWAIGDGPQLASGDEPAVCAAIEVGSLPVVLIPEYYFFALALGGVLALVIVYSNTYMIYEEYTCVFNIILVLFACLMCL